MTNTTESEANPAERLSTPPRPVRNFTGRKILGAAALVGGLTVATKGVSFGRDLIVAATLGTGDGLDAFLMASVLPTLVVTVIAGSLNSALIPTYIRTREVEGRDAAQRLLSSVLTATLIALGGLSVLLGFLVPWLMPLLTSGFSPAKLALTCRLTYILLPSIVLTGLASLWSAALNAEERFALASLAPAAVPLTSAAALLVARPGGASDAFALGFVGGVLLQAGLVGWGLYRAGVALVPRWWGGGPAVKTVLGQYLPVASGAILLNGTVLVDQTMACRLGSGSVSMLSYGNKLISLVLSILMMAIGTAVLPYFSQRTAAGDWDGLRRMLRYQGGLILLVTLPATAVLIFFSEDLVRLLFQRGTFSDADVRAVGGIQALYALQIPFVTLGLLLVRLISAMALNKLLLYGTVISFALNIILDLILMPYLGARGIALSTSLVYLASFIFLSCCVGSALRKRGRECA